jgi:type I restriction enzyme, S subunit
LALKSEWRQTTWGDEISLEYGKRLQGYRDAKGPVRVFGTNGPVGWTIKPLTSGPGVILGRKGAYRGVHFSKKPFFVIDTAYYILPKTDLNMRWLYYAIIHHKLGSIDDGSPIPSTTRSAVYVRELKVPPPYEQKAIAHILGTLDDKIELNRKMNETLEAMARAIFKSWFVDFDPVRAKAEGRKPYGMDAKTATLFPDSFRDSELGEIPRGWQLSVAFDWADYINGAAYKNIHFTDEPDALPIIKIAEIKNGIYGQTKHTNTDLGDKYKITTGDILFSWSGSPETSIDIFLWVGGRAWLNQHIFKIIPKDIGKRAFVFFLLKHLKPVFIHIAKNKQTTGLGHVTVKDLKELKVVNSGPTVINAYEKIASPLFKRMQQNMEQTICLSKIRDTLLPKLLSGEIRIKDAEKLVGESA